jgi:hypothetical protein
MKGLRKAAVSIGVLFGAALPLLAGDGQWTSEGPPTAQVYSLGLGAPGTFFAATSNGMLRSTEPGVWTPILSGGWTANVVAVDPSDPATLYVEASSLSTGNPTLFKSTDSGDHFQDLFGFPVFNFRAIAIDPTDSSTLYIGGDDGRSGVVHKSIYGGTGWTTQNTTLLATTISSLVIDPHRNDYVYAGSDLMLASSYYYSTPPPLGATDAMIATQNGGTNWTGLLQGGPSADVPGISAVAVDPQSGTIYAGASSFVGAVLRSSDSGTTWASSSVGLGLQVEGINALVVDPTSPTTIYAGTTAAGVFRSVDGGSSWTPMSDGLDADATYPDHSGLWVHSLVFNPVDGVLRAGTDNGVFAIHPNAASAPCTSSAEYLCLLGGRYRVSVMAQDPTTYVVERGVVVQNVDRFGSFSLPAFTGDPGFPEVVVKMIAAPAGLGAWVFFGGLTNLPYVLSVTDTTTGRIQTYANDSQNRLCGGADTAAFSSAQAPAARSLARAQTRASAEDGALSLLGNRFSVTLSASSASQGRTEPGVPVPVTDRYGYFSLPGFTGDPTFPEVVVKMVDFTAVTGQFLFFQTGLTNLAYTLTVTDSVTGAVKTYNGGGDYCGGVNAFSD